MNAILSLWLGVSLISKFDVESPFWHKQSIYKSPVLSHHGSKQTLLPLDFKMGTILFHVLNAYCDIFPLFMQISPENCLIKKQVQKAI